MPVLNGFHHQTRFQLASLTPCPMQGANSSYLLGSVNGVGTAGQPSWLPNPTAAQRGSASDDLAGLDGLGALLKAGEIVDRRTYQSMNDCTTTG